MTRQELVSNAEREVLMRSGVDVDLRLGEGIYRPALGSTIDEIASPALLVDLDQLHLNIRRMAELFASLPVSVRPHMKTGKSSKIARIMRENGFDGVCVTKVSEAAVMVGGGVTDLLITSPVASGVTAAWLAELLRPSVKIRIVVDSTGGADVLSRALREASVANMEVLLDLNVGQNRTGVEPGKPALNMARYIASKDNLKLVGCQGYEGHVQMVADVDEKRRISREAMESLVSTADLLRADGHEISIVTTGGTGSCLLCAEVPGVTEVQPGSFIFMDTAYTNAIGSNDFKQSLLVLATIISRPSTEKVTVDAGWKSLSIDSGPARPLNARWAYQSAGDEHGVITGEGVAGLNIGDRVLLVPGHIDTTVALHECFYIMQQNRLVDVWPVEARGRVQ